MNRLYKYLSREGFEKTIQNNSLMFSNLNKWRSDIGGDINENYVIAPLLDSDAFYLFKNVFQLSGLKSEKFFEWLLYLALSSYRMYASCFVADDNNNNPRMWEQYAEDGVCLEFDYGIVSYLSEKFGHIKPLSEGLDKPLLSIREHAINYVTELPDIKTIIEKMFDIDRFTRMAFFTKTDAYSYEKEYRILAKRVDLFDPLMVQVISKTKDYDGSYSGLAQFLYSKVGIDMEDTKPLYLSIDSRFVTGIRVNPNLKSDDKKALLDTFKEWKILADNHSEM